MSENEAGEKLKSGGQPGNQNALKHGLHKRIRNIKRRGLEAIDARTLEGRDALTFRENALADLGGKDISTTKKAVLDVAVGERFIWRSGWAFIMRDGGEKSIINKRKRAFYPIIKDVLAVGDSLTRHLKELGLERLQKTLSLQDLLDRDNGEDNEPAGDNSDAMRQGQINGRSKDGAV